MIITSPQTFYLNNIYEFEFEFVLAEVRARADRR